ncbi:hypothetical protein THAOC_28714 [Thalassiosira oceanica]|uniref:Uncharacterized protein n=1 Tax=Thalassiosira oceanica TaxID=159749 RepID=K0REB1_THAOC|nr:hypothetical protein THAOC_28714 [Thalassiosira oceanica]|eukprot:EJK52058.1 hypothetical protein THAOC_28714 [Thalassiosira oceanica]
MLCIISPLGQLVGDSSFPPRRVGIPSRPLHIAVPWLRGPPRTSKRLISNDILSSVLADIIQCCCRSLSIVPRLQIRPAMVGHAALPDELCSSAASVNNSIDCARDSLLQPTRPPKFSRCKSTSCSQEMNVECSRHCAGISID